MIFFFWKHNVHCCKKWYAKSFGFFTVNLCYKKSDILKCNMISLFEGRKYHDHLYVAPPMFNWCTSSKDFFTRDLE